MDYIKVSKAAEKWGISPRRVRILCAEGKIPGVIRKGKLYMIPENAIKPADGRLARPAIFSVIDAKKEKLAQKETESEQVVEEQLAMDLDKLTEGIIEKKHFTIDKPE